MAPMSLMLLVLLTYIIDFADAQTVIGYSSSFSSLDLPSDSSPPPTKQTPRFWPSLPPRGRSDVPIRVTGQDRLTTTNTVEQRERLHPSVTQFNHPLQSALPTQNLSSGLIVTQPTASRPRTDTASLAFSRAFRKGVATTKSSTPPPLALDSAEVAEPAGDKTVTGANPMEEAIKEKQGVDSQGLGSGIAPTVMFVKEESPDPLSTVDDEMAQYRPQAQTAVSKVSDVKTPPLDSQTVKPHLFALTTTSTTSTTSTTVASEKVMTPLSSVVTQQTLKTVQLKGEKSKMLGCYMRIIIMIMVVSIKIWIIY